MKIAVAVALCVVVLLASGCATYVAPVVPPQGLFFSRVNAPLDVDMDKTAFGSREGAASTVAVLGLFAFGDAGIHAAALEGRLTTIHHADYEYFNVLGVYQKFTTIVYGD